MNDKKKPFIAISSRSHIQDNIPSISIAKTYAHAIIQAGGIPVFVYHEDEALIKETVKQFDALLVPGGKDIHPKFYNQEVLTMDGIGEEIDDVIDISLIQAFAKENKPILGICRGLQCINVAFGGSLLQDIPTYYKGADIHDQRVHTSDEVYDGICCHEVTCVEQTQLFSYFKQEYHVNSFHHQCIDELAKGFIVSAYSKEDGIIEGIEKNRIIGVQWHPEWLLADGKSILLFQGLVNAAKHNT